MISAQETERRRLARDLHDDLSQHLAGLSIMLSGLKRSIGTPGPQADLDGMFTTLQSRAAALAKTVSNISHELHPLVLEHGGLVPALRHYCDVLQQRHPLTVTFRAGDDHGATPDVALCLFRVSQEALTNAVRHAHARTILVQLLATPGQFELGVIDDGVGFVFSDRTGAGVGLRSMDERVRLVRGHVTIDTRPGHGTALTVRIPRAV